MSSKDILASEDIVKRLDSIIRILLRQSVVQEMSSRDQINLLFSAGLKDIEIAQIMGKSRGYISSEIAKSKGRDKNGKI